MPIRLYARPPLDTAEERAIRKLAGARHAPGDWIQRARMITASWQGQTTTQIAAGLGCHPQTVRERLHRFNTCGINGLGDRPIPGRPPRLTEHERGRIIALARSRPPGRPARDDQRRDQGRLGPAEADQPAAWTLDALTGVAQAEGIGVARSQVRRILMREGVRWRRTRSWATSPDPDFAPKGRRSTPATPPRRRTPR
jgi:transposase